jgi:hypothetical protein
MLKRGTIADALSLLQEIHSAALVNKRDDETQTQLDVNLCDSAKKLAKQGWFDKAMSRD